MRFQFSLFVFLIAWLPALAGAASTHEITLSPGEVFQVSETDQWRFELQKEVIGRFADVKITPKRGDAFSLMLYFIADTPDLARLDTPEKISRSLIEGSEKYLATSVEKEVRVQPLTVRGSYGALTVLTDAGARPAPGGFSYLTRGMVRLSPDSALGFSLLSKEIKTPSYRQLLAYVYGFIRTRPAAVTAPAVAAPAPVATSKTESRPAPKAATTRPGKAGNPHDLRDCLSLPSNAEIMRCTQSRQ